MKLQLYILFIIVFGNLCTAQYVLQGVVTDNDNIPLSGATVTISLSSETAIIAYGITDSSGRFVTSGFKQTDSVVVKVSFLGFKPYSKQLKLPVSQITLALQPTTETLKEVEVKASIISQKGDTIRYTVVAFKGQEDRVIADIIKKLPGIIINGDGTIYYQGNPIQKYYIEGLDLLEGNYNLANENLPADAVADVEILENHQPLKVLDSIESTGSASLNIKLKKDVVFSGTAELNLGTPPMLWKANVTPMMFAKKKQFIASYQANNVGKELSGNFSNLYTNDQNYSLANESWLHVLKLSKPSFSKAVWLDNNSHFGSLNFLTPLRKGKTTQLKFKANYLNDIQYQSGNTETFYFTGIDTITMKEINTGSYTMNHVTTDVIIENNVAEKYLKNNLKYNGYWSSDMAFTNRNNQEISQTLYNPQSGIQNYLELLTPVGKQLITINANIGYNHVNQQLDVTPGQFIDVFNSGNNYQTISQELQHRKLFTENSVGLKKLINKFSVAPKIGVLYNHETLESDFIIDEAPFRDANFINNIVFNDAIVFSETDLRYTSIDKTIQIRANLPIQYRTINVERGAAFDSKLKKLLFQPKIYLEKKLNSNWKVNVNAAIRNDFGNLHTLYNSYLLTNYNNLSRSQSDISEKRTTSVAGAVNYRNPRKQLFATGGYSFETAKSNTLYKNSIAENGTQLLEAVMYNNNSVSHNFHLNFNTYFRKLKTTLKINGDYRLSRSPQLINENYFKLQSNYYNYGVKIASNPLSWFSLTYSVLLSEYQTKQAGGLIQKVNLTSQQMETYFFLSKQQQLELKGEFYNSSMVNNGANFFANLSYKYTFIRPKIDVFVSWNNIANTKEFVKTMSDTYYFATTTYKLRPSQILMGLQFSF